MMAHTRSCKNSLDSRASGVLPQDGAQSAKAATERCSVWDLTTFSTTQGIVALAGQEWRYVPSA